MDVELNKKFEQAIGLENHFLAGIK